MKGSVDLGHGKQEVGARLLRKIQAVQDGGPDMAACTSDNHHRDRLHQAVNAHLANGLVPFSLSLPYTVAALLWNIKDLTTDNLLRDLACLG